MQAMQFLHIMQFRDSPFPCNIQFLEGKRGDFQKLSTCDDKFPLVLPLGVAVTLTGSTMNCVIFHLFLITLLLITKLWVLENKMVGFLFHLFCSCTVQLVSIQLQCPPLFDVAPAWPQFFTARHQNLIGQIKIKMMHSTEIS